MPERAISARSDNPRRFQIPADNAAEREVIVILPDDRAPAAHQIVKKDIPPSALSQRWNGKPVTWLNNFGIRQGGQFVNFAYSVVVDPPGKGQTLVYFDGTTVQAFNDADLDRAPSDHPGKWKAILRLGDPPIGWGG
ncbi:MAG TPA: hypothetical protein VMT73_08195 [Anaerolineales bacterium]|nr:hypothetical protein [Anaerolineales bacterium]